MAGPLRPHPSGAWPRPQGSWSITQGFTEIPQYPVVTFRKQAVAVQLRDVHTPRFGRTVPASVAFTGKGRGAGLELTARNRVEFDGFVLTDLTIAPAPGSSPGSEGVRVDQLYWELVMPESEATHFCVTAGGWSAIYDVTPARWTSQSTGPGMLIGDFVPYIWLTNSDRAVPTQEGSAKQVRMRCNGV